MLRKIFCTILLLFSGMLIANPEDQKGTQDPILSVAWNSKTLKITYLQEKFPEHSEKTYFLSALNLQRLTEEHLLYEELINIQGIKALETALTQQMSTSILLRTNQTPLFFIEATFPNRAPHLKIYGTFSSIPIFLLEALKSLDINKKSKLNLAVKIGGAIAAGGTLLGGAVLAKNGYFDSPTTKPPQSAKNLLEPLPDNPADLETDSETETPGTLLPNPRRRTEIEDDSCFMPQVPLEMSAQETKGSIFFTLGFNCDQQSGLMCGWHTVCNSLRIIEAIKNVRKNHILNRMRSCRFYTSDTIAKKKAMFDAMADHRIRAADEDARESDELTGPSILQRLYTYLATPEGLPKPISQGAAGALPQAIGKALYTHTNFPISIGRLQNILNINALIQTLKTSGAPTEQIVEIFKEKKRDTHGSAKILHGTEITSNHLTSIETYFREINKTVAIEYDATLQDVLIPLNNVHDLLDSGHVIIYAHLQGGGSIGHWRSKCFFKEDGNIYFGTADSLSPGTTHLSKDDQRFIKFIFNSPFTEENNALVRAVFTT